MSSKQIMNYFHYFNPSEIEWLNDTSCNVVFPSEDNALQALNTSCMDKIEDFSSFENVKRSALGYQVNDEVIPMFIRFATAGDVKKEEVKAKDSKFYKWQKKNSLRHKAISRRNDKNAHRKNR